MTDDGLISLELCKKRINMPTRNFRYEYIRNIVFEQGDIEEEICKGYDHGGGYENLMVVFRAKDDGKFYAYEYGYNGEHAIFSVHLANGSTTTRPKDDDTVALREVEKKVIATHSWHYVQ